MPQRLTDAGVSVRYTSQQDSSKHRRVYAEKSISKVRSRATSRFRSFQCRVFHTASFRIMYKAFLSALLGLGAFSLAHPADLFNRVRQHAPLIEKRAPGEQFENAELAKRAHSFLNNNTQQFVVDGTAIPDVSFDIGESYAGLLPISGDPNETRKLFFWFFPTTNANPQEEITIWFNGGPGCSSLSGLLTENGPFTWDAGTLAPVQNPYTWV